MTTLPKLTTRCPHCGRELLTLSGVLVSLDESDGRKKSLGTLDVACDCAQSKQAAEEEKRARHASKCLEKAKAEAKALAARLVVSGLPEAWHNRGLAKWSADSTARSLAKEQAIAFGAEMVAHSKKPRSLYIAGDIGTGKTYLASCIAADLIRRKVQTKWCNVGDVLRAIRSSFDKKNTTEEETIRQFTEPLVLVLDDLGKERPTEWAVEQLFSIINTRYDACRPLIVTTNYGGADLVRRLTPRGEADDTTPRAIVDRLRGTATLIKLEGDSRR